MENLDKLSRYEVLEYITTHTNELDLLVAIAEEASELSKAALKLARARKYVNHPTPVDSSQAFANLMEEYADVRLCADALALDVDSTVLHKKTLRWARRLQVAAADKKEE